MAGKAKPRSEVIQPSDLSIKHIALTQDQIAIVDSSDYEELKQYNWFAHWCNTSKRFYAARNERVGPYKQRTVRMHNHLLGRIKGLRVDHKNVDSLDNRRVNLRHCTSVQNGHNRPLNRNNSSGYKGVNYYAKTNKWTAVLRVNRKRFCLGYFETAEKASQAYQKASKDIIGEFSYQQ